MIVVNGVRLDFDLESFLVEAYTLRTTLDQEERQRKIDGIVSVLTREFSFLNKQVRILFTI